VTQPPDQSDIIRPPVYPEITRAQWAVLSAWTDQRCIHMMEAADFVADLSPEAKNFLKNADEKKIKELNANLEFFSTSRAVWKFIWIGGGILISLVIGISQFIKIAGDYITVKIK
jgi:mannose/fructose/N-acetylgalactosamine-specific phosphotransferase system component IID